MGAMHFDKEEGTLSHEIQGAIVGKRFLGKGLAAVPAFILTADILLPVLGSGARC